MPERLGLQPYAAHATYQFSGTPGKRNRFREKLLWDDPPEYFNSPNGYVSYTPNLPQALRDKAGPNTNDFTLNNVQVGIERCQVGMLCACLCVCVCCKGGLLGQHYHLMDMFYHLMFFHLIIMLYNFIII